jgi:23S rRNA maturation-related 3'-5' exoribonuclease YhaM
MPLKLIPPRKGKTPYWSVRGTYLGQYVDRSTKAVRRAVAKQVLE